MFDPFTQHVIRGFEINRGHHGDQVFDLVQVGRGITQTESPTLADAKLKQATLDIKKRELELRKANNDVLSIEERKRPAEEMAKTGRYIYMFGFTDHLENCINAVRRLFHHFSSVFHG